LIAAFERGERHGDVRVDDMQSTVVRRKAKLRNDGTGPGSSGSHRLYPDHCAICAKRSVNKRRAMQDQVESEEQSQRTRKAKEPDQAIRDQAAPALREALLPGELETGSLNALTSLPKLGAAEGGDFTSASGLKPGARGTRGPVRADSTAGRRGHGGSLAGPTPRWRLQARGGAELPMLAHARAGLEARFARERDILASLEHPSDAQGNAAFTATLLSFEELGLSASKRPDDKGR
jgi:hypothetical protein